MLSPVLDALAGLGDFLAGLADTLLGGALAVVGGMLGAWWTTRHAALDRQHRACQEMLRLTRRIREALGVEEAKHRELRNAEDPDAEHPLKGLLSLPPEALYGATVRRRYEAAHAEIDHLAGELAIFAAARRHHRRLLH